MTHSVEGGFMHKKILITFLSWILMFSLPVSQTMTIRAEEPADEEPVTEEVRQTEEEPASEEAELTEKQTSEVTEEDPESNQEEISGTEEPEEKITDDPADAEETGEETPLLEEEEESLSEALSEEDPVFYVAGIEVPVEGSGTLNIESEFITSGTVTYDYGSNTLTLDHVVIVNDPEETVPDSPGTKSIYRSGTDGLAVKLIGENAITVQSDKWSIYRIRGIEVDGLLTFTSDDGTGSLNLNVLNPSSNLNAYAISSRNVSIENCTLNVYGETHAFVIRGELHFGADANVTAVSSNSTAIDNFSKGVKVTHDPLVSDMFGFENAEDEEGSALYEPVYEYDYYSWNPFEYFHKVIVNARDISGTVVLSGNCGADGDNATFALTDEGVLTISGTGAMADYNCSDYNTETNPPWYNSQITYVKSAVIGEGITHIGNYAFYNCSLLTEAAISSTVESIGNYAFCDSVNLTEPVLPSSLRTIGDYAFSYCRAFEKIIIPEGTESIGEDAFSGCEKAGILTLPDTLTHLGNYAFYDCVTIPSVTLPAHLAYLGRGVFAECTSLSGTVTIPDGITEVNDSLFRSCENLEGVNIPDGVTKIGPDAFSGCTQLREIDLPSALTVIGEDAFSYSGLTSIDIPEGVAALPQDTFYKCYDLESAHLPDSLRTIDRYAFEYCTSLKTINLPEGLTSIGYGTFRNCGLEEIVIPSSITSWGSESFTNDTSLRKVTVNSGTDHIAYRAFMNCTSLSEVIIGDSVTTISDQAFSSCTSLESIYLPDNVAYLYNSVFSGCTNLKNVRLSPKTVYISGGVFAACSQLEALELPDGLWTLGDSVFEGCASLTSLTIPETVSSIGVSAFKNCTALAELNIPASISQYSIGASMFENCVSLTEITIPDSVRGFDSYAFRGCTSLEHIHFNGVLENVFYYDSYAVGYNVFDNCPSLTELSLTFRNQNDVVYNAFATLPEGLVQVYGIPGGTLEQSAAARNYTFHSICFTVQYFANGGEGEMEDQLIDYTGFTEDSDPYYFTLNAFTNGTLTFIGWNTKADGSGTSYEDGQAVPVDIPSSGVMTLYAQWAEAYDLWIKGVLIHSKNKDDIGMALNGYSNPDYPVTYDPVTNTLTMNTGFYVTNYNNFKDGAGPEYYSGLYYAGERELTLVVTTYANFISSGYAGVGDISGLYSAAPVRIEFSRNETWSGTPKLEIESRGSSIDMCGMYVGGNLTVSGDGELYVRSQYADNGHSYALRMGGGTLKMAGKARAYLLPGYGSAGSYGLYLDGNTTLRASNWTSVLDIQSNAGFAAIGGANGVTLSQRASELDLRGYSTPNFYGDETILNETSYPVSALASHKSIRASAVNHVMSVSLAEPDRHYVYTGSAITPAIIVTCRGNILTEGQDYTVKYKNNTKAFVLPAGVEKDQEGFLELPAKQRNEAPQIIVTGKGNLAGTATLYFEIYPKSLVPGDTADGTVPVKAADLTLVSGSKASPVLYYGTYKLTNKDYVTDPAASVKYTENAVITITGQGNFTGSVEVPVTVVPNKASLKNIAVDFGVKSLVYNGKDRTEDILAGIHVYNSADKTKTDIGQEHYLVTMSGNTKDAGTV